MHSLYKHKSDIIQGAEDLSDIVMLFEYIIYCLILLRCVPPPPIALFCFPDHYVFDLLALVEQRNFQNIHQHIF